MAQHLDLIREARRRVAAGDAEGAAGLLMPLVGQGSANAEVFQALIDIRVGQRNAMACMDVYEKGLEHGFLRLALGQLQFAVMSRLEPELVQATASRLEDLVARFPGVGRSPRLLLAVLYAETGRLEQGMQLNQRILGVPPSPPETWRPPHFLVIGTIKGGTTSFYDYLCLHPQVRPALYKELRYFGLNPRHDRGFPWYLSHFPQEAGCVFGEATPGYLSAPLAPVRVRAAMPDVKLIVCLRDPAARALSNYHMEVRAGRMQESLPELLERCRQTLPLPGPQALRSLGLPACITHSFYEQHLRMWLAHFPREQLHVVQTERLAGEPGAVLAETHRFLGLDPHDIQEEVVRNTGSYETPSGLQEELAAYLRPFNAGLGDLLGCRLDWLAR